MAVSHEAIPNLNLHFIVARESRYLTNAYTHGVCEAYYFLLTHRFVKLQSVGVMCEISPEAARISLTQSLSAHFLADQSSRDSV